MVGAGETVFYVANFHSAVNIIRNWGILWSIKLTARRWPVPIQWFLCLESVRGGRLAPREALTAEPLRTEVINP